MPSISWTYKDYWDWYTQIEEDKRKTEAMVELLGNGWLARLSADQQVQIFAHAPEEILLNLKHIPKIIKKETLLILQFERDKKSRKIKRR